MKRILAQSAAILALASGLSASPAGAADVPGTSCTVFPVNNAWNMDIRKLPVHPKSATWKRATHAGTTRLHPDFGPPSYGIPFDAVPSSHAKVSIDFHYADESDPGPYPFGGDVQVEGGSDRHAIMIDEGTCVLYELFGVRRNGGARPRAAARSSTCTPMPSARPGGPARMRPGCRSSPVSSATTRSSARTPASTTPCASPSVAPAGATSGRRGTRPVSRTRRVRRWAHGSGSRPDTT